MIEAQKSRWLHLKQKAAYKTVFVGKITLNLNLHEILTWQLSKRINFVNQDLHLSTRLN